MEELKAPILKASYVPQAGMLNPKTLDKVTKDMQNYPQPFTLNQDGINQKTQYKNSPDAPIMPEELPSTPEITPGKGFSIRAIVPIVSYHFNDNGHAKYADGNVVDTSRIINVDGKSLNPYIHNKSYNEFNPGIGLGVSLDRSASYPKGLIFDPRDIEPFVVGYKNSYNNTAIVGGVNYTPFIAKFETKLLGNFLAKLGVSAGVAYTQNGNYPRNGPSIGNFTALATGLGIIEHEGTGLGLQINGIPPVNKLDGMVSVALSKSFRSVF